MSKEKTVPYETIRKQWLDFARTPAYRQFIQFIQAQKETYNIIAGGPLEVSRDVMTSEGTKDVQFEFEPEKYAYLLQRGVGCDIVKLYVEGYTDVSA